MMEKLDFTGYEDRIPANTQRGLRDYVEKGYYPGGFLTAVLCNDLFRAVNSADSQNAAALVDIVAFIYNRVPADAWGNAQKLRDWVDIVHSVRSV